MSSRPLLIIQMGVPPDDIKGRFGEQGRWMQEALGHGRDSGTDGAPSSTDFPLTIVRPSLGEDLPAADTVAGAIITGAWEMVTDLADWSEHTAGWIRQAHALGVPSLGICYGHQLMAHALGGVVDFHPAGRELGCHAVQTVADVSDDPLLHHLPPDFFAMLSHEQSVMQLPACARVMARSSHDAHQILRYGDHALSLQFHPEFSPALMQACITRRAAELSAEGIDVDAMVQAIADTPHAHGVLVRFAQQAWAGARAFSPVAAAI